MRRFKTTPLKKLAGMLILFVFIPLFLLWYFIFFLGNKPGLDTILILVCVAVLAAYFYLRYKKQIDALAAGQPPFQAAGDLPKEAEELSEEAKELNEEAEELTAEAEEFDESDEFGGGQIEEDSGKLAEGVVPKPK